MTYEETQKIKLEYIKNNRLMYQRNKDLVDIYNEYTKKIAELFLHIMDKDDDLFYTTIFDILLEIGFFSYNKCFSDKKDEFPELVIKPGISIVNGYGLCRNIACFYEDIFKNIYNYPLKICCFDDNSQKNDFTNTYGNHAINLSFHNNVFYGYDIRNSCLFLPISDKRLKALGVEYYLLYKPNGNFLLELLSDIEGKKEYQDALKIAYLLDLSSYGKYINEKEYLKIIDDVDEFMTKNRELFKNFFVKNEDYQKEIKEKMLLLK